MIYRCKDLGILNAEQVKYMWKQMNARGIRKKEPLDNAFTLSRPTVLASAARMLIDNNLKLPQQIADEMVLNSDDIESLCALPPGTLQNKVVQFKVYR